MRSLYAKLALALLAALLTLGAVVILLAVGSSRLFLAEAQQRLHGDLAANIVGEKLLMEDGALRAETVQDLFMALMLVNPSIEVYLLDASGEILTYSAPPGRVVRERVDLSPVRRFLAGERLPVYGDDPRGLARRAIFSAAPLVDDGGAQGYLYIVLAGEEHASVFGLLEASWILRLTTGLVLVSLLLAGGAALLLTRRLTHPLRALAREMEAFAEAELVAAPSSQAVPGDEIEQLTVRFRQMAERLREQLRVLAATDRGRRDLVAGVSHDLRTPLTHLQGYLETLLLKEDLAEGDRRRYLEIAYQECLRLARLVADLFELAKLESLQAPVEREVFSLPELAHDVSQKFRLRARKKGVEVEVQTGAGPGLVDADLRLLERVLENLLDNAVRYTPEGGRVAVEVAPADDAIAIAVADTGPGIPPEEIPHVFDRFYRGRRQSRAPGDGAGLGLAIARRALQLHGGDLECESLAGSGTTFRFALPTAAGAEVGALPVSRPTAAGVKET